MVWTCPPPSSRATDLVIRFMAIWTVFMREVRLAKSSGKPFEVKLKATWEGNQKVLVLASATEETDVSKSMSTSLSPFNALCLLDADGSSAILSVDAMG